MNLDFRRLKYFIAVAEELNIGRAALRLNISQPPLTRQIHLLEEDLGVQLLIRTSRGVELTQAGTLFLQEAHNIRSLTSQALERTKRASEGKLGRLDIGVFGTGVLGAIPELLHQFRQTHPDVRVELHPMPKQEQIEALRQKRITMGFNRMISPQPDIESRLILKEQLYLALPADNPLALQESVSFMELSRYPLVLFPTGARPNYVDRVLELCRNKNFTPDISQIVGDAVTGLGLVAGGFCVSIVPESATNLKHQRICYIPFNDAPEAWTDLTCIYIRGNPSPILSAFLAVINRFHQDNE
jgi:DNA-binding transcriptional LysR family regulator